MKVQASREQNEPSTDIFLRDEDGGLVALWADDLETAERVAAFINRIRFRM